MTFILGDIEGANFAGGSDLSTSAAASGAGARLGGVRGQSQRLIGSTRSPRQIGQEMYSLLASRRAAKEVALSHNVGLNIIERRLAADTDVTTSVVELLDQPIVFNARSPACLTAFINIDLDLDGTFGALSGTWDSYISIDDVDLDDQSARIKANGNQVYDSAMRIVCASLLPGWHIVRWKAVATVDTAPAKANRSRLVLSITHSAGTSLATSVMVPASAL